MFKTRNNFLYHMKFIFLSVSSKNSSEFLHITNLIINSPNSP